MINKDLSTKAPKIEFKKMPDYSFPLLNVSLLISFSLKTVVFYYQMN